MINIPFSLNKILGGSVTPEDEQYAERITIELHRFFNGDVRKEYKPAYIVSSDSYTEDYVDVQAPYTIEDRFKSGLQKDTVALEPENSADKASVTPSKGSIEALTFGDVKQALDSITGQDNTDLVVKWHKSIFGDRFNPEDKIKSHYNVKTHKPNEYEIEDRLSDKTVFRRKSSSSSTTLYHLTYNDFYDFFLNHLTDNK